MTPNTWPLTVLAKSIHYKNLTAASKFVGLSQPQLSRLISKLEDEFNIILLDRTVKRKSSWTPIAFKLAEIFVHSQRQLEADIRSQLLDDIPKELHIATLEGLSEYSIALCKYLLDSTAVNKIHVHVWDQLEIEQRFSRGELDFIFTFQVPGKQKLSHSIPLGYQTIDPVNINNKYQILSTYEFNRLHEGEPEIQDKYLISNSLSLRNLWLSEYGGRGYNPSPLLKNKPKSKDFVTIYLIGKEMTNKKIWDSIKKFYS